MWLSKYKCNIQFKQNTFWKITSNMETNYSKSYNQDCEFKLEIFKILEILFIDFSRDNKFDFNSYWNTRWHLIECVTETYILIYNHITVIIYDF